MIANQVQDTWKLSRKYLDKGKWFTGFVPNSCQSRWKMLSLITFAKLNQLFWSLKQVPNRNMLFLRGRGRGGGEDENENQRMIHGCNIFLLNNDGLWYNMNMSCLHCTLQRDLTGNSKSNYTNTIPEICFIRYCYRYPVLKTLKWVFTSGVKHPRKCFKLLIIRQLFLISTLILSCCNLNPLLLVLPISNKWKSNDYSFPLCSRILCTKRLLSSPPSSLF